MNILKLATVLLVSVATITPSAEKITTKLQEVFISPLYMRGNTPIAIKVFVSKRAPIDVSLKIFNGKYSSGVEIYANTFTSSGVYFINYNNAYTHGVDDNEIEITYKISSTVKTLRHYVNLGYGQYEYIDDNKKITSHYDSYLWHDYWSFGKQDYLFTNFDDVYMPNFYQKIDISDFKVKISGTSKDYFKTSGTFVFNNLNGMFQDLCAPGSSRVVKLPVSFSTLGNGVYKLNFDIDLFVNKQTLNMSREKKDDYIKTKYIYLPRNNMRYQEEIECSLQFDEFGSDKDSISHTFTLKAINNVMGDCHNSEYCVIRK